jgi:hypothetical protein
VIFLTSDMLILVDKLWIEGLLFVVDRMVFWMGFFVLCCLAFGDSVMYIGETIC